MLTLSKSQLDTLEDLVVRDYLESLIAAWKERCESLALPYFNRLTYEQHVYFGEQVIAACERRHVTEQVIVTTLIFRVWQAAALGFGQPFLADTLRFVLDECGAHQFGFDWLAHYLDAAEQQALSRTTLVASSS
jgi:hypothetical protein